MGAGTAARTGPGANAHALADAEEPHPLEKRVRQRLRILACEESWTPQRARRSKLNPNVKTAPAPVQAALIQSLFSHFQPRKR